ncbi:PREDICTED: uncharacterized protein LOC109173870 isoform X2 [Ipomoea nil]|nr:PREDICTED: uncharacterized protein LOC109173870 isoform X2 [Ipomoea nil]
MVFPIAFAVMILVFPVGEAAELSARSLDALLQERAFRALVRPKTGVPYAGKVPAGLAGIGVSALRLRSGSMRRKGFGNFKEFTVPVGVVAQPYVERLVLVYHNLGNWSDVYYPLPEGYVHLTPVLGLLAYDAANLSASELPELELRASENPMLIKFSSLKPPPTAAETAATGTMSAKCVFFDLHGSLEFDNVVDGNICRGTKHGHFSIILEFTVPVPAPAVAATGEDNTNKKENKKGDNKILWVTFGTVIGAVVMAIFLIFIFVCTRKNRRQERIHRMEEASERGVPLPMATVGHTRAPVASKTRTKPLLESEYVV